ncbi:MAG: V-type ATP synthase subunit K [Spirochaetota bacterium]
MNFDFFGSAAALAFAACGSAAGSGIAGMAAIGSWKKCFIQNKPAPFLLIVFVGAPLSQTIYGMILMNAVLAASGTDPVIKLSAGVFGGIAIGMSALFQGKAGASGCDALAETGKGFGNFIMVIGVIETVALFVMVLLLSILG